MELSKGKKKVLNALTSKTSFDRSSCKVLKIFVALNLLLHCPKPLSLSTFRSFRVYRCSNVLSKVAKANNPRRAYSFVI